MNKVKAWIVKDNNDGELMAHTSDDIKCEVDKACKRLNLINKEQSFIVVPVEITEITNEQRS